MDVLEAAERLIEEGLEMGVRKRLAGSDLRERERRKERRD